MAVKIPIPITTYVLPFSFSQRIDIFQSQIPAVAQITTTKSKFLFFMFILIIIFVFKLVVKFTFTYKVWMNFSAANVYRKVEVSKCKDRN